MCLSRVSVCVCQWKCVCLLCVCACSSTDNRVYWMGWVIALGCEQIHVREVFYQCSCVYRNKSLVLKSFIQRAHSQGQKCTAMCVFVCKIEKESEETTRCKKQPWLKQHEAFKPLRFLSQQSIQGQSWITHPPTRAHTHTHTQKPILFGAPPQKQKESLHLTCGLFTWFNLSTPWQPSRKPSSEGSNWNLKTH